MGSGKQPLLRSCDGEGGSFRRRCWRIKIYRMTGFSARQDSAHLNIYVTPFPDTARYGPIFRVYPEPGVHAAQNAPWRDATSSQAAKQIFEISSHHPPPNLSHMSPEMVSASSQKKKCGILGATGTGSQPLFSPRRLSFSWPTLHFPHWRLASLFHDPCPRRESSISRQGILRSSQLETLRRHPRSRISIDGPYL